MKSLWNDAESKPILNNVLKLRVYTSQLLGKEPSLVLHGGGNTSVKMTKKNLFNENEELLLVKGSGWDLATIQEQGFVPVRLGPLKKSILLDQLTDTEMVHLQRAAMTDPTLPAPSVEAILHAIIPYDFVDHTHADAVVTLTNTPQGESLVRDLFGPEVLVLPYVMPGFILAKQVYEHTKNINWQTLKGIILMHHGVFSFGSNAKSSYENMLQLVTRAEEYLNQHASKKTVPSRTVQLNLLELARIRKAVSQAKGAPVVATLDNSPEALAFAQNPKALELASRGPLTPDHVIRTKPFPVLISENPEPAVQAYVTAYQTYFQRNASAGLTCLNPAPCWAIWPEQGILSFGSTPKEAQIVTDILAHTRSAIGQAEGLGGWRPLHEKDIFALEYWELEQAKLKKPGNAPEFQGKVVLVTGAASGIGRACVEAFQALGASVAAWDLNPDITTLFKTSSVLPVQCNVTDLKQVKANLDQVIEHFGGLDVLVSNAGTFPASETIAALKPETWLKSMEINLTSHQQLLTLCIPYLAQGLDPAVILVASKNVPAPGAGASAYSVAKAGLTQLGRIAALELAPQGIRVNMVHPNAVFDTKIWNPEVLAKRAEHYGMSVDAYKTNNLLKVEITSHDVARLVCTLAGPAFAKTTGAQIPIDGGNDRVI